MSDNNNAAESGLKPCPWCGAVSDAEDEWGSLITHKKDCYWKNIHGDSIGRVRVDNSEKKVWNTRAQGELSSANDKRATELNLLLSEAAYLLTISAPEQCPNWKEGVGDCGMCGVCRIFKCTEKLEQALFPTPIPTEPNTATFTLPPVNDKRIAELTLLRRWVTFRENRRWNIYEEDYLEGRQLYRETAMLLAAQPDSKENRDG